MSSNEKFGTGLRTSFVKKVTKIEECFDLKWSDESIPALLTKIEVWIRRKLFWDFRDKYDREQIACDTVYAAITYFQSRKCFWTDSEMNAMCLTIAKRKIANVLKSSNRNKNHSVLSNFSGKNEFEEKPQRNENRADLETELFDSIEHIWSIFDESKKRVCELLSTNDSTIDAIALELNISPSTVRRIRTDAIRIACAHLGVRGHTKHKRKKTKNSAIRISANNSDKYKVI